MKTKDIRKCVMGIAMQYPDSLQAGQIRDVDRITYNIKLAIGDANPADMSICDIGGGIGLFSPACASLGFKRVILVDDFQDEINEKMGNDIFDIHKMHNVQIVSRDVVTSGLGELENEVIDVYTVFEAMEHWHHSPKNLFAQIRKSLAPEGRFIVSVPNNANIRKRIAMLVGKNSWSSMQDWYEKELFRGHVREPNVSDLRYIARDMGLANVEIIGRNWSARYVTKRFIRRLAVTADYLIRPFPTLCTSIYLIGSSKNH